MESTTSHDFDLAVCYRIYPRLAANTILGFTDKLALVQLNLETFKEAIGNLKIKMWVLLDNCPPAYPELVKSIFPRRSMELIELGGEGNEALLSGRLIFWRANRIPGWFILPRTTTCICPIHWNRRWVLCSDIRRRMP